MLDSISTVFELVAYTLIQYTNILIVYLGSNIEITKSSISMEINERR